MKQYIVQDEATDEILVLQTGTPEVIRQLTRVVLNNQNTATILVKP